jgi:hypothetical protein
MKITWHVGARISPEPHRFRWLGMTLSSREEIASKYLWHNNAIDSILPILGYGQKDNNP